MCVWRIQNGNLEIQSPHLPTSNILSTNRRKLEEGDEANSGMV